jgi:hypothetical protein
MRRQYRRNHGDFIPTLTLHQGGLSRSCSPQHQLDRAARDLAAGCKRVSPNTSTAYPCRAVADMAVGLRFPLRIVARIIVAVLKGGGPVEFGEEIGILIITFNAQMASELGRTTQRDDRRAA